mmetsp:Transcript_64141/g.170001  ORF Transcript_64141/g.170001 Transcript_64141/m.170001 type:complete len:260 (+) Transcript_64141:473-1252(+)
MVDPVATQSRRQENVHVHVTCDVGIERVLDLEDAPIQPFVIVAFPFHFKVVRSDDLEHVQPHSAAELKAPHPSLAAVHRPEHLCNHVAAEQLKLEVFQLAVSFFEVLHCHEVPQQVATEEFCEFLEGENRNPHDAGKGQHVVENSALHVSRSFRVDVMQHHMTIAQDHGGSHILDVKQDFSPIPDAVLGTMAVVMPNTRKRRARYHLDENKEPHREEVVVHDRETHKNVERQDDCGCHVKLIVGSLDFPLHLRLKDFFL